MTKVHFAAIARSFLASKPSKGANRLRHLQWQIDVSVMADTVGQFNDRFDRAKFLAACGVE